jgi:hypothetical protein
MLTGLSHALKGSTGQYELSRVVGFVGGMSYIAGAHAFVAWEMARGGHFDLVAYCAAFPGGLAIAAGGTAVAVAVKDRNVATAKATEASTNATNADAESTRADTEERSAQEGQG